MSEERQMYELHYTFTADPDEWDGIVQRFLDDIKAHGGGYAGRAGRVFRDTPPTQTTSNEKGEAGE